MASTPKKRPLSNLNKCSPSPKRARNDLSLGQKISLIEESEKGPKVMQKVLSQKYGIGVATVSDILRRQDFYWEQFKHSSSQQRLRLIVSESKFGDLNEIIFKWFGTSES